MSRKYRRDPYGLVGMTLGNYRLLEYVGVGGMGAVYKAEHLLGRKILALKVIKPDLAETNPDAVSYFFEEAAKAWRLDHEYIVRISHTDIAQISDGDSHGEIAFIAMEWLEGRTLDREVKESGALSPAYVADLLEQICDAMAYAHGQGIVHRDLKPSNIMLVPGKGGRPCVKILDFGIAKALDATSDAFNSRIVGAPLYSSPEQLTVNSRISPRSDIYSLGVTLYQLLTGTLPFNAGTFIELVNLHLTAPPPSLRRVRPEISEAVEAVVNRAMAKRPEDRYGGMSELALAFRRAAGVESGALALKCLSAATGEAVAGASVYLDGDFAGETDANGDFEKRDLTPAGHLVRVNAHRFQLWQERVAVGPGGETTVAVELSPKDAGELIVETSVPGAEVFLNGARAGETDGAGVLYLRDLSPGPAGVEVRHRGYAPAVVESHVVEDHPTRLRVELKDLPTFSTRWAGAYGRSRRALGRAYAGAVRKVVLAWLLPVALIVAGASLWWVYTTPPREADGLAASFSEARRLLLAGDRLRGLGKHAAAAGAYADAARQEPHCLECYENSGDASLSAGDTSLDASDYAKAEAAYREAVRLAPAFAADHYKLGDALFKQKMYGESAAAYYEAVRLAEDVAEYRYKLGESYRMAGRSKCAEFEYREAIRLGPDRHEYHYGRGMAFFVRSKFRDAAPEFQKALKLLSPAPPGDERANEYKTKLEKSLGADYGESGYSPDLASERCAVN